MVPFRIIVDFGDVSMPLAERQVLVPRTGTGAVEVFEFTRNEPPPAVVEPVTAQPAAELPTLPPLPPISVSVYQHGMFCEIVEIPQERSAVS